MSIFRVRPLAALLTAFVVSAQTTVAGAQVQRQPDRSLPTATRQAAPETPDPERRIQVASNGRYPFGQVHGGYRYPYNYPYYRYGPRNYPFGNGPYGPYGSNWGGYSGNPYNPGMYGSPRPIAPRALPAPATPAVPADPDDPDAPDAAPDAAPAPLQPTEGPRQIRPQPPALSQPVPGTRPQPVPNASSDYGDPAPYWGSHMYNSKYGSSRCLGMHPNSYTNHDMWYGHNGRVTPFNAYPTVNYPYSYGAPSGFGFYSPEYAPEYYNGPPRNFGPAYPPVGGIEGGGPALPGQ